MKNLITDTTMFKSFANWSDLDKKSSGYKLYAQLSNGYFVPVRKSALKKVADSMNKNDERFLGQITMLTGIKAMQISFL